ncbi:class I SAM-dependent methyltransferase [Microvirga solisilvae]|uniref:class I SAM-dependent methyltransferase n=1 Tax=Microvirga solisilvae TaxID=2919498 RepID=UPI001FAF4518|nr:class I SAM-dependent methyltransferase [Microvirga solisilvae]
MDSWNSGYVTDVDYTHGFYRDLTPNLLNFVALLHNVDVPGGDLTPRAYCELGCGQGFTTNLLAAANPHIEFYATDFNPRHISNAQSLAEEAGLGNVHFSDNSFGEYLQRHDLPDFDFITLHGIYSWVLPEVRQEIVQFIRRKLKPGGVVYISYNAMPGWASVMPLRRLMIEHADSLGSSRPLMPRVKSSMAFLDALKDADADYFTRHPSLNQHLDYMKKNSLNYIVHEYFGRDMTPFYFTDLARELSEAKLTWVGHSRPTMGMDDLQLTGEQRNLLDGIEDPSFRETVRDHMINQKFRRDIFVKGPTKLNGKASQKKWLDQRFTLVNGDKLSSNISGRRHGAQLNEAIFKDLVAALENGPRSLGDLMSMPEFSHLQMKGLVDILTFLIDQDSCFPCLPADGQAERILRANRFNKVVAQRTRDRQKQHAFASGVTGGGLPHDKTAQMIWLSMQDSRGNVIEALRENLNQAGLRLNVGGNASSSDDETLHGLRAIIESPDHQKMQTFWRATGLIEAQEANPKPQQQLKIA